MASRVVRARTIVSRTIGLMGRLGMEPGEGLWLDPCTSIHTFFMRFPIDVLFLDRDRKVVRVIDRMKPWRVTPWIRGAQSALELQGGSLKGAVAAGDVLEFK